MTEETMSKEIFAVIYCPEDDSHAIISENDIVCALDHFQEGEKVQFFYPGYKKSFHGTVKKTRSDYDELARVLRELNSTTKPATNRSFHEDQPRRAAVNHKVLSGRGSRAGSNQRKPPTSSKRKSPVEVAADPVIQKKSKASSEKIKERNNNESPLAKLLSTHLSESEASESEEISKAIPNRSLPQKQLNKNCDKPSTSVSKDMEVKYDESVSLLLIEGDDVTVSSAFDEDNSDSGSSLDEAQIKLLAKLAKKKKYKDMRDLSELVKQSSSKFSGVAEKGGKRETFKPPQVAENAEKREAPQTSPKAAYNMEKIDKLKNNEDASSESSGQESLHKNEESPEKNTGDEMPKKDNDVFDSSGHETTDDESKKRPQMYQRKNKRDKREVKLIDFKGNFFRFSGTESKPELEQLSTNQNIWVAKNVLQDIKRKWRSGTAIARSLSRHVFSDEALLACSVSGKVKVTKDGNAEKRTALDPDGVEAVLAFAKMRCDKKNWPKPSDSALKQAINNMLFEERSCKVEVDLAKN